MSKEALKPCPFCGGNGLIKHDAGSWGYRSATVWCECEQGCCSRRAFETEKWEAGKGTFSIKDEAERNAIAAWNTRDTAMKEGVDLEAGAKAIASSIYHSEGLETMNYMGVEDYANREWQHYSNEAKACANAWGLPTKQKEGV